MKTLSITFLLLLSISAFGQTKKPLPPRKPIEVVKDSTHIFVSRLDIVKNLKLQLQAVNDSILLTPLGKRQFELSVRLNDFDVQMKNDSIKVEKPKK